MHLFREGRREEGKGKEEGDGRGKKGEGEKRGRGRGGGEAEPALYVVSHRSHSLKIQQRC